MKNQAMGLKAQRQKAVLVRFLGSPSEKGMDWWANVPEQPHDFLLINNY